MKELKEEIHVWIRKGVELGVASFSYDEENGDIDLDILNEQGTWDNYRLELDLTPNT
jgi:hypothetical protein